MLLLTPKIQETLGTYGIFENVVTPGQCKTIIELSKSFPKETAKIDVNHDKRVSDIHWIYNNEETKGLYAGLGDVVTKANNLWWDFHISGFVEPLQLTYYTSKKQGHYDWHMDRGDKGIMQCRKISGSLVLNDGYEGGDLELFDSKPTGKLKPGDLVLFPSYHVHRVTPVTKGERWSLVFWITGPRWI